LKFKDIFDFGCWIFGNYVELKFVTYFIKKLKPNKSFNLMFQM